MNKFVISTQYLENYGFPSGNGSFKAGGFRYKFKGGDDYIVSGFDRIQDAVAYIAEKYCAVADDAGKEFPTKWRNYDDWLVELAELDEDYRQFLLDVATEVEYKEV